MSKMKLKDSKTLRLFFSSPFGGMEEEREELTRKYFPQFQHLCNSRGIQFVPVDMRWGITSEAADNAQVINICLREIDRSDVFIGFFGQRYGWHGESDELLQRNFDNAMQKYPWLVNYRGKSVTELEFLHGHLNNPGAIPASICFRDKAYDEAVQQECLAKDKKSKMVKYMAESDHSTMLMKDLIQRVKETESKCLGLLLDYKNPIEATKFMFESVWECCKELVSGSESQVVSQLEQNRLFHDTFMAFRTSLYYGGEVYFDQLRPDSLKDHPTVLVRGSAGSGKSALLANYVKWLKESEEEINLIYHFVGCAQGTTNSKSILQRILSELQHINGTETKEDSSAAQSLAQTKVSNKFHEIFLKVKTEMQQASSNGKNVLIIIDGLEKVNASSKTEKHLYWIPEEFPPGVSLIVSTENTDLNTIELLVHQKHFYDIEILPLDTVTQEIISKETLLIKGKELSPHQLERIVRVEQTKNPLFLKIVLSEISIYGYFRLLDKKIDSLIYCDGVKDLLTKVLERLEEDYNSNNLNSPLVQQVLSAIAVSHCGLSEEELVKMFCLSSTSWSPFYFSMEIFFIKHEGLLRFAFLEFENAVKERYLKSPDEREVAIKKLVNYFEKQRQNDIQTPEMLFSMVIRRVAEELPYLQSEINDKHGLIKTLRDVRIFHVLEKKNEYELIDLLNCTGCKQDEIVELLFASYDKAITHLYNYQQENETINEEPPGYLLMPVLESMKKIFSIANYHRAHVKTLLRIINILEGIHNKVNDTIRQTKLRENRYFLACAYVDNTEYDKAQELHESVMMECRNMLELIKEDKVIKQTLAYTCNGLGILHLKQQHYEEAESLLKESQRLHTEIENELCAAEAVQNLGIAKLETNQPDVALKHFQEAMKVFESVYFGHLPLEVGNLLTNMALCYRRMEDFDLAEAMYQRSLQVKAKAVGWNHEVIATCYMNLGTLEFYRKNNCKAEEYTRKAIEIYEKNEVKLEQNEMWMAQENLVANLIAQEKWEEALPIFLKVFKLVKKENLIDQASASIHREMIRYMTHVKMFEESADVAICHINSHKQRQPIFYLLLDFCDRQAALSSESQPPKRDKTLSVRYALEEIWPGNNELTAYIAQTYLVPDNNLAELLTLVNKMDEMNPNFTWTCYKVAEEWCADNKKMALAVLTKGLEKYPDSSYLKSKLFDCHRDLKQFTEAYSLVKEVIASEPDNQALLLVAGDVACKTGDLELCMELWAKVSLMPDTNLSQMAKSALKNIQDYLDSEDKTNT
ncbi:TPR repeat-containing protein isoform X1 [Biomphalaria glabrata]|nr:TPR repeat-containing protein isoform X1 [Biomphalaria glabrata]